MYNATLTTVTISQQQIPKISSNFCFSYLTLAKSMPQTELLIPAPQTLLCFFILLYLMKWCHHLPLTQVRESKTPLLSLSPDFPLALTSILSPNFIHWTNAIYLNFAHWCLLPLVIASPSHYQGFLLALKWKQNPLAHPTRSCVVCTMPLPQSLWVTPPLAYYAQCGRQIILIVSPFHASLCPYPCVMAPHTDSELMSFTFLGRCYLLGNLT